MGQSNMSGRAEPPYYECAQSGVWCWNATSGSIVGLEDPYASESPFDGAAALGSMIPRLADYMRANGFDDVGFIPITKGGTRSALFLPGDGSGIYEAAVAQTLQVLATSGATLGGLIIYQGESDTTASAPATVKLQENWETIIDALEVDLGLAPGALRVGVVVLPTAAPTSSSGITQVKWDEARAQLAAIAAGRVDAFSVQAPATELDGGGVPKLHLHMGSDDTGGMRKLGVDFGAAAVANWL